MEGGFLEKEIVHDWLRPVTGNSHRGRTNGSHLSLGTLFTVQSFKVRLLWKGGMSVILISAIFGA